MANVTNVNSSLPYAQRGERSDMQRELGARFTAIHRTTLTEGSDAVSDAALAVVKENVGKVKLGLAGRVEERLLTGTSKVLGLFGFSRASKKLKQVRANVVTGKALANDPELNSAKNVTAKADQSAFQAKLAQIRKEVKEEGKEVSKKEEKEEKKD